MLYLFPYVIRSISMLQRLTFGQSILNHTKVIVKTFVLNLTKSML